MTIIVERPHKARAKRKIIPSFRHEGGPLPRGIAEPLPIDKKDQKDQSSTGGSGLQ